MIKLSKLTDFLGQLESAKIHYTLASVREGAVMVGVTVPGERWEIEFMADGDIEVEVFKSNGAIHDDSVLDELFRRHSTEQRHLTHGGRWTESS